MLRQFRTCIVLLAGLFAAAGCGIKGPLVLPPPAPPPVVPPAVAPGPTPSTLMAPAPADKKP